MNSQQEGSLLSGQDQDTRTVARHQTGARHEMPGGTTKKHRVLCQHEAILERESKTYFPGYQAVLLAPRIPIAGETPALPGRIDQRKTLGWARKRSFLKSKVILPARCIWHRERHAHTPRRVLILTSSDVQPFLT